MVSTNPVLRGGTVPDAPYPLGQIPDQVVLDVSKAIAHSCAVGRDDISGDDWSDMFAAAVGARHLKSPLGITDVTLGRAAWSAKTVQSSNVSGQKTVRLISGRNAVDFSFQNQDPRSDPQLAGGQVLQIWNARLEDARRQYSNLRTVVLMREMSNFRFKMFELEPQLYDPAQYIWAENKKRNLEGRLRNKQNTHVFTWQPAGSQFTIIADVPSSGRTFDLTKPRRLNMEDQLKAIDYSDSWVTLLVPGIAGIEFASKPQNGGRYGTGEAISLAVSFADTVFVEGDPVFRLRVGQLDREASYLSGSGTRQLVFRYVVATGDRAPNGVRIESDALGLNDGSIMAENGRSAKRGRKDEHGQPDEHGRTADLSHPSLKANRDHRVLGK